eukprot:68887-Chlamydomonas_euryale.AAC.1
MANGNRSPTVATAKRRRVARVEPGVPKSNLARLAPVKKHRSNAGIKDRAPRLRTLSQHMACVRGA